jgi:protein SCO1/2
MAHAVSLPTQNAVTAGSVVQIDEPRYLGARLPVDTVFEDETGANFALADVLGKPVILVLSYYGCDGTCPTMNLELASALGKLDRFKLGQDFRVLTVSFDSRDTARTATEFLKRTGLGSAQSWRHAVLKSMDVKSFAGSIGFNYFWSDAAKAFMHPNVLVFLTPEGRVARYIYGTRMDAGTIELALIDADWNRISNSSAVFDMLTGACFSYNYAEGKYQVNYSLVAGVGSLVLGITLLGLGSWAYRRKMGRAHEPLN